MAFSVSNLLRRKKKAAEDARSLRPLGESFRQASLSTRTLITVLSMLAAFGLFVGLLSVAAISATKAVFPTEGRTGAFPPTANESLASPSGASEAKARSAKKPLAKGEPSE